MIVSRILQEKSDSTNDTNPDGESGSIFGDGTCGYSCDVIVVNPPYCGCEMPMNMEEEFP